MIILNPDHLLTNVNIRVGRQTYTSRECGGNLGQLLFTPNWLFIFYTFLVNCPPGMWGEKEQLKLVPAWRSRPELHPKIHYTLFNILLSLCH